MIPVDQTTFGIPGGNCFSACVASLLNLPIDDVPYFMGAENWLTAFTEWLRLYSMYPIVFKVNTSPDDTWRPAGYHILGGQSVRGPHSVVARGHDIVHDPHPSRSGLILIEDAVVLVPLDPGLASQA
jgi:hypothetical protein